MTNNKQTNRFVMAGLREDDYRNAWGCSRQEALYNTPYERDDWNPDDYEHNQQY